ncbi:helix-turn-helix domain-containing protein [Microbacterium sp. NPDC058345]|uniref:helix-turn-helix domain-containing protein n=1 Tax=Microbacterium sp. NPDC058345 TaxID=3346455 RepID=UPI00365DE104
MKQRIDRRIELGLTQTDAARRASVSLATWRRWEEDPDSVSQKTRDACEGVLAARSEHERALEKLTNSFTTAWQDSPRLTPRQAYAIALELDTWDDLFLKPWLDDPREPLHTRPPFDDFDLRVMMLIGESRAWVAAVQERCRVISDEIKRGILPFDRPGPLIDEVLIGAALSGAQASLEDLPESFEHVPAREAVDDEENDEYLIGDDDWDAVSDGFDDICRWDEWEVPIRLGHPLLPAVLAQRHPYTWFDAEEATGPGYLQRLSGLIVDG